MNVILLQNLRNFGKLGDHVQVKRGFGRNYLLPKGKAVPATAANVEMFESRRSELEQAAKDLLSKDQQRAENINDLQISLPVRASDEGKLYGSVGIHDIVKAIKNAGHEVNKQEIILPDGSFRALGDYQVKLSLHHGEVTATINIAIIAE